MLIGYQKCFSSSTIVLFLWCRSGCIQTICDLRLIERVTAEKPLFLFSGLWGVPCRHSRLYSFRRPTIRIRAKYLPASASSTSASERNISVPASSQAFSYWSQSRQPSG